MQRRIVHLWKSDYLGGGGGAVAMYRLHNYLRRFGLDSKIICETKTTESEHVSLISRWRRLESILERLTTRLGLNDIHRISSFKVGREPVFLNSEITHFHGIHSGFISYLFLPYLTKMHPTVFTLQDMWCLTGHCFYSYDCEKWKTGCGKCPYPNVPASIKRDGTHIEWLLKKWSYNRSKLAIVGVSKWLAELARQSILNSFPIYHIPYGIDIELYKPLEKSVCRSVLGIPQNKKVLMFSAISMKDQRKGGELLLKALKILPEKLKKDTVILLLGHMGESIAEAAGIEAINLGYISNDMIKAAVYSSADLFILPTRAEAFGIVIIESFACGTPVVAFDVGGVPETVRHGITGYLAKRESYEDLSSGIIQLLDDKARLNQIKENCRDIAVKEYSMDLYIKRHVKLYQDVIENKQLHNSNYES